MAKSSRDGNTIDSLLPECELCLCSIRVHPTSTGHHVLSLVSLLQVELTYSTTALVSFAWCSECIYSCTLLYMVFTWYTDRWQNHWIIYMDSNLISPNSRNFSVPESWQCATISTLTTMSYLATYRWQNHHAMTISSIAVCMIELSVRFVC